MTQGSTTTLARLLTLLLWGCLLLLSGCSTGSWAFGSFRQTNVQLTDLRMIRGSLLQQQVELTFRVVNTNDFDLRVKGLDYLIYIDQIPIVEGKASTWLRIPANSVKTIQIPIQANLWQHGQRMIKEIRRPNHPHPYRFKGDLKVGRFFNLLTRKLPIDQSGELTPSKHHLISIPKPSVDDAGAAEPEATTN